MHYYSSSSSIHSSPEVNSFFDPLSFQLNTKDFYEHRNIIKDLTNRYFSVSVDYIYDYNVPLIANLAKNNSELNEIKDLGFVANMNLSTVFDEVYQSINEQYFLSENTYIDKKLFGCILQNEYLVGLEVSKAFASLVIKNIQQDVNYHIKAHDLRSDSEDSKKRKYESSSDTAQSYKKLKTETSPQIITSASTITSTTVLDSATTTTFSSQIANSKSKDLEDEDKSTHEKDFSRKVPGSL